MQYLGHEHQSKNASVVYWIHHKKHSNIFAQGYVGITNQTAKERWQGHRNAASKKTGRNSCAALNRAINKYDDLIFEVILVADTREYCERIEGLLRPKQRIGWNIARGGMPVDTFMGGMAIKYRWLEHWKNNPTEAANRWWKAEMVELRKQIKRLRVKERRFNNDPTTRAISSRNKVGCTGVTWYKPYGKWLSQIMFNRRLYCIGYYSSIDEAIEARKNAEVLVIAYKNGEIDDKTAVSLMRAKRSLES